MTHVLRQVDEALRLSFPVLTVPPDADGKTQDDGKSDTEGVVRTEGGTGLLCLTDKESFFGLLNEWHAIWDGFLSERTDDERESPFYSLKNMRREYY